MARHNVVAEMGRLNLLPRGSAAWCRQRELVLSHLATDDTTPVRPAPAAGRRSARSFAA
ncbi:MAG: hypothetical protein JWQ81_6502 [Amycolatopsis sp.]|uniref:hypothetical protein n=1 Tax=Amycolatopsis sp. TaxID=37632 RepID=UPI0026031AD1|nr:hypothetical protein [Amycolatopsis sp.]MCU1685763.1 hypothetical protein [Amycolatopsis sp.]